MIKRIVGPIIIILLVGAVIGLFKANKWILGEVSEMTKAAEIKPTESVQIKEKLKPKKRVGDVIRKTRLAPERSFERSIFYQGGEVIAEYKMSQKGVVYEQTGEIPDGRVKFINETDKTYGVESYWNNLRHGLARTNYNNGSLKIEASYDKGVLMTRKEYFHDGLLKMEEDYSDAREYMDDRDVGIGKMYTRDGKVKYEWYMINSDPVGYYKSYNRKGKLTTALYFDEFGVEMPPKKSSEAKNNVPPPPNLP